MATHPGSCPLPEPEGWTPAALEAVRHASAKKDQGLLVVLPVKSSLMSVCPCAASGAASAASAANRAGKVPKVFRFIITDNSGRRCPERPRKCFRRLRPLSLIRHSRRHQSG